MLKRKNFNFLFFLFLILILSFNSLESLSLHSPPPPSHHRRKLSSHFCPASTNQNHFQAGLLGYPIEFVNKPPSYSTTQRHNCSFSISKYSSIRLSRHDLIVYIIYR